MGWGNHHASYDEPCTQADIDAFRRRLAAEARGRNEAVRQDDHARLRRWYVESRDMTVRAAGELWYELFPKYRYRDGYYGPHPPEICDHWARRLPPTPVVRGVESPLWWAARPRVL
jgi:hypothetical protein